MNLEMLMVLHLGGRTSGAGLWAAASGGRPRVEKTAGGLRPGFSAPAPYPTTSSVAFVTPSRPISSVTFTFITVTLGSLGFHEGSQIASNVPSPKDQ